LLTDRLEDCELSEELLRLDTELDDNELKELSELDDSDDSELLLEDSLE